MRKKRRTNGFGRRYADVLVVVSQPHDKLLVGDGWVVASRTSVATTFEYTCVNRYEGDDESVVDCLMRELPIEKYDIPFMIDWDNATY